MSFKGSRVLLSEFLFLFSLVTAAELFQSTNIVTESYFLSFEKARLILSTNLETPITCPLLIWARCQCQSYIANFKLQNYEKSFFF